MKMPLIDKPHPIRTIFGGSRVSSLFIISVVRPRRSIATKTLASRFSIALSWHLTVTTRGMLVRQAAKISAIMLDSRVNNSSSVISKLLLS
ncbi:hypothetical protein HanRHA438_Chr16g0770271 [Helianthus annuus]|nr:hypothetical protein HanRHA438_Chr16g0770271 [Helianthus annuus]